MKATAKGFKSIFTGLVSWALVLSPLLAAPIDWGKVGRLQGKDFLAYVESLDLKGQQALDFWKRIPVSRANKQVNRLFRKEAFAIYMKKCPRSEGRAESFTPGMGTEAIGPLSGQALKLPFTGYHPLPEGPIGDPNRTYRVGYTIHGLGHPWLLNNADSAQWEARRHANVELTVLDPEFDNQKQVAQIDAWVKGRVDGLRCGPPASAKP